MQIVRGNAWTDIEGAPQWFLDYVGRHLSVPVELGTKTGARYARIWFYEGEPWGSLLHKNRLAAGLTSRVVSLANHYRVPFRLVDAREAPPWAAPLDSVKLAWRPYQDAVHAAFLESPVGIVDAVPRSGKTNMAARIVDHVGHPVLWIAPSVQIVKQTYNVLCRHFGEHSVSRLDGDALPHQRDLEKHIVVATTASALKQEREWFKTRKMLISDEFHHSGAESLHRISALAENAYYRYGFTGTHFRSGEDELAMHAVCSDVLYKISVGDLVPTWLARPQVEFVEVAHPRIVSRDYRTAYQKGIVDNPARNDEVVRVTRELMQKGVPTIVLVKRRAHADQLGAMLGDGAVVVKGGEGDLTSKGVQDFADGKFLALVGTTVLGEGVDLPRAAALVYASAGDATVLMMQSYFRPLTAHPGKETAQIYDFKDSMHGLLLRHSRRRADLARGYFGAHAVAF